MSVKAPTAYFPLGNPAANATGSVASFNPNLYRGNYGKLILWLKPDPGHICIDITGSVPASSSGDWVSYWKDSSGLGRHARQGNDFLKPLFKSSSTGGYPALWLPAQFFRNLPNLALQGSIDCSLISTHYDSDAHLFYTPGMGQVRGSTMWPPLTNYNLTANNDVQTVTIFIVCQFVSQTFDPQIYPNGRQVAIGLDQMFINQSFIEPGSIGYWGSLNSFTADSPKCFTRAFCSGTFDPVVLTWQISQPVNAAQTTTDCDEQLPYPQFTTGISTRESFLYPRSALWVNGTLMTASSGQQFDAIRLGRINQISIGGIGGHWQQYSEGGLFTANYVMSGTISEVLVFVNWDVPRKSVDVDSVNNYLKAKYGL